MGKRIISQRRGKGTFPYRSKKREEIKLPKKEGKAKVIDIKHVSGRDTPIAKIQFEDNSTEYVVAPVGLTTSQELEISPEAKPALGNIIPLGKIPEGSSVYFMESKYKDGGKYCKSSGTFAIVKSHEKENTYIQLPSKKIKKLKNNCRAIVGKPAGYGRVSKPFLKAGIKWRRIKSRGGLFPKTSGSKMNPVDHPYGGKTKPGQSTSTSRHASPGRKVGSIAPKRTGKRKKK